MVAIIIWYKKTTNLADVVVFYLNHNFGFKQVLNNNIAPSDYLQQQEYNKKVLMYILTKSISYGNI